MNPALNGKALVGGGILTAGYRPGLYLPNRRQWRDQGKLFTWLDVEDMRSDPIIAFGLKILQAPIAGAKWKVHCDNPEVAEFVDQQYNRIWQRDLPKILSIFEFGTAGGEVVYRLDPNSGWEVDALRDIHIADLQPTKHDGRVASLSVKSVAGGGGKGGAIPLPSPRWWWVENQPRFGSLYGYSRLAGAWEPWQERTAQKGAKDARRTWYFKNAYRGGMMRHPMGVNMEISPGVYRSCEEYAREILEKFETGGILTLPNFKDDQGEYAWTFEPPVINGELKDVREYVKDLGDEELTGMGIPTEIIQASEVGSGWSGRSIPLLVFLGSLDPTVAAIIQALDRQVIWHLVRINFGNVAYEVEPVSLVPKNTDPMEGGGQGGEGGGNGGQPQPGQGQPKPGMGPQPLQLSKDATGHEHKGKGEGGGQFTAGSSGGDAGGKTSGTSNADKLKAAKEAHESAKAAHVTARGDYHQARKEAFAEMGAKAKKHRNDADASITSLNDLVNGINPFGDIKSPDELTPILDAEAAKAIAKAGIPAAEFWKTEAGRELDRSFVKRIAASKELFEPIDEAYLELDQLQTDLAHNTETAAEKWELLPQVRDAAIALRDIEGVPPEAKAQCDQIIAQVDAAKKSLKEYSTIRKEMKAIRADPTRLSLLDDNSDRSGTESADDTVDALIDRGAAGGIAISEEIRARIREAVKKKVPWPELLTQVRQIIAEYEPLLARTLSDSMLAAWLTAGEKLASRIDFQPPRGGPPFDFTLPADTPDEGEPVVFFPQIERAAMGLAAKQALTRPQYDALAETARMQAFTVAKLTSLDAIERIQRLLEQDIREGGTLREFQARVDAALGESMLSPGHQENIYRTNVGQAYADGQRRMLAHPIIGEEFPYVAYESVADSRRRPEHGWFATHGLNGTNCYRTDDPTIQKFWPPFGFQCRCGATMLTIEQAARRGVAEANRWVESGEQPVVPQFVKAPSFDLPPGWVRLSVDATGHKHKGKGKGGGQFTATDSGGSAGSGGKKKAVKPKIEEQQPSEKAIRAKAAHVMVDKTIQRYAEEHNEPKFSKAVGGVSFPDGEPVDVAVAGEDGVVAHGIELKTMVANTNMKVTMKRSAMERKAEWERKNKAPFHTVVLDDHAVFNANGEGKHDENKRVMYYRRGYGSFRVQTMHKVKDIAELKNLMNTKEADLPAAAQRPAGQKFGRLA